MVATPGNRIRTLAGVALAVSAHRGIPASAPPPHVTLTVTRSNSPEARTVMEASIAGIASPDDTDLLEQAAAEAGDLERCVVWA